MADLILRKMSRIIVYRGFRFGIVQEGGRLCLELSTLGQ
jgi:hypothetical protein